MSKISRQRKKMYYVEGGKHEDDGRLLVSNNDTQGTMEYHLQSTLG